MRMRNHHRTIHRELNVKPVNRRVASPRRQIEGTSCDGTVIAVVGIVIVVMVVMAVIVGWRPALWPLWHLVADPRRTEARKRSVRSGAALNGVATST